MKAILIDAVSQEVREVEIDPRRELQTIYKSLGCRCMCSGGALEVHEEREEYDTVYVDDEGHVRGRTEGFKLTGCQPLCGNGLILGVDFEGESVDPVTGIDWVRKNVEFFDWTPETRPSLMPQIYADPGAYSWGD